MEYGFNPDEIVEQNQDLKQQNKDMNMALHNQMSLMGGENQDNLIRWQLDLKEDLDRIYHLLRGDQIDYDEEGNVIYTEEKNPDLRPFNDFGVKMIMNIMAFYLNRNTILSNYDDPTIKYKLLDLGIDLSDLIFNRYEDMMMTIDIEKDVEKLIGHPVKRLSNGRYVVSVKYEDGEVEYENVGDSVLNYIDEIMSEHLKNKTKLFPIIHRELMDSIHSAYLRAFNGGERESLRTARTVIQNEPIYRNQNPATGSGQQQTPVKSGWLHPGSW